MTPSEVGERAEAAVVAALVHNGRSVYLPFGASGRCDLIYEQGKRLYRMQVKNGVLRNNAVRFATCSTTNDERRDYRNDVDVLGVYCDELACVFVVPVDAVPRSFGLLRVGPPRNNQQRGIRWAEQFRLEWSPTVLESDPDVC